MRTLVIKNFPEDLHARLKAQAQRHHRSVTKEVVSLVEAGLIESRESPGSYAPGARSGERALGVADIDAAIADERYVRFRSIAELNRYMDELRKDR